MFWILYLISIADSVRCTLGCIGWILLVVYGIIVFVIYCISLYNYFEYGEEDADFEKNKKVATKMLTNKFVFVICFICITLSVFIPSSKNLLIIFGVSKFTESEIFYQTNETAKKSIMLLNKKLDKYLEDEKVEKEE